MDLFSWLFLLLMVLLSNKETMVANNMLYSSLVEVFPESQVRILIYALSIDHRITMIIVNHVNVYWFLNMIHAKLCNLNNVMSCNSNFVMVIDKYLLCLKLFVWNKCVTSSMSQHTRDNILFLHQLSLSKIYNVYSVY